MTCCKGIKYNVIVVLLYLTRCLDPREEIDLINVAFEQRSSQGSEIK